MFDSICIQAEAGHELLLIAGELYISQIIIHEGIGKHGQQRTTFRALALAHQLSLKAK